MYQYKVVHEMYDDAANIDFSKAADIYQVRRAVDEAYHELIRNGVQYQSTQDMFSNHAIEHKLMMWMFALACRIHPVTNANLRMVARWTRREMSAAKHLLEKLLQDTEAKTELRAERVALCSIMQTVFSNERVYNNTRNFLDQLFCYNGILPMVEMPKKKTASYTHRITPTSKTLNDVLQEYAATKPTLTPLAQNHDINNFFAEEDD